MVAVFFSLGSSHFLLSLPASEIQLGGSGPRTQALWTASSQASRKAWRLRTWCQGREGLLPTATCKLASGLAPGGGGRSEGRQLPGE